MHYVSTNIFFSCTAARPCGSTGTIYYYQVQDLVPLPLIIYTFSNVILQV